MNERRKTVLFIVLGVMALAAVLSLTLSFFTELDRITIAVVVLTMCSAVADTLAIVLYLRGKA